jgi:hypothetical protein
MRIQSSGMFQSICAIFLFCNLILAYAAPTSAIKATVLGWNNLGTHSITAVYSGDTNNATSTSSVLKQVMN